MCCNLALLPEFLFVLWYPCKYRCQRTCCVCFRTIENVFRKRQTTQIRQAEQIGLRWEFFWISQWKRKFQFSTILSTKRHNARNHKHPNYISKLYDPPWRPGPAPRRTYKRNKRQICTRAGKKEARPNSWRSHHLQKRHKWSVPGKVNGGQR